MRSISASIGLKVPPTVVSEARPSPYLTDGKPIHRPERLNDDAFSIVARYDPEYRGLVEYYRMAYNLHSLNRLRWVMETSLDQNAGPQTQGQRLGGVPALQDHDPTERGPTEGAPGHRGRGRGKQPLVATWGSSRPRPGRHRVELDDGPQRSGTRGPNWWNGSWPTPASCAARGSTSRSTTSGR